MRVKFVDLPRTDPVLVDVFSHRRVQVAHHDPDLHGLGEDRVAHRRTSCAQHGTARKFRQVTAQRLFVEASLGVGRLGSCFSFGYSENGVSCR
jgi:hypothetical protein